MVSVTIYASMKPGNPYGKDAFRYGSEDNQALRNLQAARAERVKLAAPAPRRDPIPPPSAPFYPKNDSPSSATIGPNREAGRASGGGGLIAGIGKLILIGFIALAVIGYLNSKSSGSAPGTTPGNVPPSTQPDASPSASPFASDLPNEASTPRQSSNAPQVVDTAPATVPATENPTTAPAEDPIGNGGFISAVPTATDVNVCVPPALVDSYSWDSPATGSAMLAFKNCIANVIRQHGDGKSQYKITDDAFDRFEQGQQSPNPYIPDPSAVIQTIPLGQPCPATNYTYTIQVRG